MSYNPTVDAPRNKAQLVICADYFEALENEKAQPNPSYKPKSRAELEKLYSIFLDHEPEEQTPLTTEQLFGQLRSIRDAKLSEYDRKIAELERRTRLGEDVSDALSAWDGYALALCNLPAQEGAPWDGGGSLTPWPAKPEQAD